MRGIDGVLYTGVREQETMRGCGVRCWVAVLAVAASGLSLTAQEVKRPRITGISHVAFYVSDLPKAISFWHTFWVMTRCTT